MRPARLGLLGELDHPDAGGATARAAASRPNPLHAAPGSPASIRDLVKTVQRWTVRR